MIKTVPTSQPVPTVFGISKLLSVRVVYVYIKVGTGIDGWDSSL